MNTHNMFYAEIIMKYYVDTLSNLELCMIFTPSNFLFFDLYKMFCKEGFNRRNLNCIIRLVVKPVYNYGLRLDFGDRFRYLYSNDLTLEN